MPRRARWGRAAGAGSSAWPARSARHSRRGARGRSWVVSCAGGGGAGVLRAEEAFEHLQPVGPEALVEAEPLVGAGERAGGEAAQMRAAAHLAPEQPGVLQHLDVLRGRRERDREGGCQLADRTRTLGEVAQHLPARGVAKGMKNGIELRSL